MMIATGVRSRDRVRGMNTPQRVKLLSQTLLPFMLSSHLMLSVHVTCTLLMDSACCTHTVSNQPVQT